MDQPVQDDESPSGLEKPISEFPATTPERTEADITRMDRYQLGVHPPGRRLRGHDTDARGRGHPRQPTMFIMTEVSAMLKEESHPIRVPNTTVWPPPPDGIPTESTQAAELTLEAQDVREVLLEVMEDKGEGKASLKVERLCALLDPRRKALGADRLVNDSTALRTRAEEDLKGVIAECADAQTQPSVPVPAPVLNVESAEPAPKKKRLSRLEERREARLRAVTGGGGDSGSAEP